jgi:hypothetical protein
MGLLFIFYLGYTDSEIRAKHLAEAAVRTCFGIGSIRVVIPLLIEILRLLKHTSGAKLDTKAATFAPVFYDLYLAMDRLDFIFV